MTALRPFWRYYGGKWRSAPRYPAPRHATIIEPFAGAAGYAMRYPNRRVILVERYAVIAEVWRYLIGVSASEVRRIPLVDAVDDLPAWVPPGGRWLVGFSMNSATTSPRKAISAGWRRLRDERGRNFGGWTEAHRARVAEQVDAIRHWSIIEGDYTEAPDIEAVWFIDPPYNNAAGRHYVHADINYGTLGNWCRGRAGQVIVCENEGADWLPFRAFATMKAGPRSVGSNEAIWTNDPPALGVG